MASPFTRFFNRLLQTLTSPTTKEKTLAKVYRFDPQTHSQELQKKVDELLTEYNHATPDKKQVIVVDIAAQKRELEKLRRTVTEKIIIDRIDNVLTKINNLYAIIDKKVKPNPQAPILHQQVQSHTGMANVKLSTQQKTLSQCLETLKNLANEQDDLAVGAFQTDKFAIESTQSDRYAGQVSLIDNPLAKTGDVIAMAYAYPQARDQKVINILNHYTSAPENKGKPLFTIIECVASLNVLRKRVDDLNKASPDEREAIMSVFPLEMDDLINKMQQAPDNRIRDMAPKIQALYQDFLPEKNKPSP